MTPKSAQLRRLHHPAGISAHPAFTIASSQRATLAVVGAPQPSSHRTTGALALAPAFPLALTTGVPGTGPSPSPQPAPDPSALWLRTAAAGLGVLAAAAAAVSFTAQYRMVNATRHLARHRRPGSRHPRRRRPGLRQPRHRPGPARPPRPARPRPQPRLRRRQRRDEHPGRRTRLAQPGHLGPPAGRLRPGQRHPDHRPPRPRPAPAATSPPDATPLAALGRLALWLLRLALAPASTLAGFRAWVLAQCPAHPRTPAGPLAVPGRGPAPHQDGPLPRPSHRTTWASRLDPPPRHRPHRRRPWPLSPT